MEASIVDLRYHMKKVLAALNRRETVVITYRGRKKGLLVPETDGVEKTAGDLRKHPLFASGKRDKRRVDQVMRELRGGRYNAL